MLAPTSVSHRQYRHPNKSGRVTVAGRSSDEIAPGTLNSIFKQAGLKER
jgi:predicted RNA binding protein YcfA (HicA-like mRNA interferase family)